MKEYKERIYRGSFAKDGRVVFVVSYKESDLWVAVDDDSFVDGMPAFCLAELERVWRAMEKYLAADPEYRSSLTPHPAGPGAPDIMRRMSDVARITGIGPMGGVAGAVASHLAGRIKAQYDCREILIENGGDVYACFASPLEVAVFAGDSPLSEKVGFSIPPEFSPLGICTSAGTVGPSLSFGKADAVMIICRDVILADSYATAFGNEVKTAEDIDATIERIGALPEILAGLVIKGDRMGAVGEFDLRFFR